MQACLTNMSESQNANKLIFPMQIFHQLKKMLTINKDPLVLSLVYTKSTTD